MSIIILLVVVFIIFKALTKKTKYEQSQKLDNQDMFSEKNNDKTNERNEPKSNWLDAFLGNMNQIQEKVNESINNQNQVQKKVIKQDDLSYRKQTPQTVHTQVPYQKIDKSLNIEPQKVYHRVDIKNDEFEVWRKSFYEDVYRYLDASEYLGKEKLEK